MIFLLLFFQWLAFFLPGTPPASPALSDRTGSDSLSFPAPEPVVCNCEIRQGGTTYPINALQGTVSAAAFYSYGNPLGACANTGLEIGNALILFLYEDINTGLTSIFLIADIPNDADGGSMEFELSCLPANSYVVVQDDPGEFGGSPPVIAGNWSWGTCCTDGGVVENLGCTNSFNVDLLAASGIDSILWLTGDIANPTLLPISLSGEVITIDCGGPVCCPIGFDTDIMITDAGCPDNEDGAIDLEPEDGTPPYTYDWSNGETTQDISGLAPGVYEVTITDANDCTEELTITVDYISDAPNANPAQLEACSDNDEAIFDLTTIDNDVNGGSGDGVFFFEDMNLSVPINNPGNYLSPTTTIYAVTDNGFCFSEPVPIDLIVHLIPIGEPADMSLCEEQNEMATFDLTTLDNAVSGGSGSVLWFEDVLLTDPINEPDAFVSGSTIVYAVIDDGNCMSEPVEVELVVFLKPVGDPAGASECGDANQYAVFDLTAIEPEITGGNGAVDWYLEFELLDPIFNVTDFETQSTIVYAVIFDGQCDSDPIPVDLVVEITPPANPWTISACDNGSGMAWFDLWAYEDSIGGNGSVDWYLDEFLTEPIPNPGAFLTESTIIFATVDNGICVSDPVPITLDVVPGPPGNPTSMESCVDSTGQGIFDLTTIEGFVSGGIGTVEWFSDPQATMPVPQPDSVTSPVSLTVYAVVTLGTCVSIPVPVDLVIISAVTATPVTWSECDEGNDTAVFDLTLIEPSVSQGSGQVSWFLDPAGGMPILNTNAFISTDSVIYAQVTAGSCASEIVAVTLDALAVPTANDLAPSVCGDPAGQAVIDLAQWDAAVSQGTGLVSWFSDPAYTASVTIPNALPTGDTTVYALVSDGNCESHAVVVIDVLEGPLALPAEWAYCILPGDTVAVDLTPVHDSILGTPGVVNWFSGPGGINFIPDPTGYPLWTSDTLYAQVTDGTCTSPFVPVAIEVLAQPTAAGITLFGCADTSAYAVFDLTLANAIVADGSGAVSWYIDVALTTPVGNPTAFQAGDSVIYALVTNAICTAGPVPVVLSVTDSLIAVPQVFRTCVESANSTTIDLTGLDVDVSGGSGQVSWYRDSLAMDMILDPTSFVTAGDTVFAVITQGGCRSAPAAVIIEVVRADPPLPQCVFTAIDSVAFVWTDVAPGYTLSYWLNGTPVGAGINWNATTWGLGALGQGETITLVVSALADTVCAGPIVNTATCVTDICPTVDITFPGLASTYCRDEPFILLTPQPAGGQLSGPGISGDTLYPAQVAGSNATITYDWLDGATGCTYDGAAIVSFLEPPQDPVVTCDGSDLYSISFDWAGSTGPFGYKYSINGGPASSPTVTSSTDTVIAVPNQGGEVVFSIWSVGAAPCANSDTIVLACNSRICQPATITLDDPGTLCSNDPPVQLQVTIPELTGSYSVTWSGPGILDPSGRFDPAQATTGNLAILVEVEQDGCVYSASFDLTVQPQPKADFDILGTRCADELLDVIFTGSASSQATFAWDFAGGDTLPAAPPALFSITWPTAGQYEVQLVVTDNGCPSEAVAVPVQVDAPLALPEPVCEEEDYYTVTISWPPLSGATAYEVSASSGRVSTSGTTATVHQLEDGKPVTITVVATGPTVCGPSQATIECHTIPFIPPLAYVPNVFSPDGDGLNDVFFVQTNEEIRSVSAMRVFDRWGDVLFERFDALPNDPSAGWDGTFHGQPMNPDVFVYWIEVVTVKDVKMILAGDVTIVR